MGSDFDQVMGREPVTRFLAWTDGKKPTEIANHPVLRNSPQAGLISDLLSKATRSDKELILRYALGDEAALEKLQIQAPAIAAQYRRMKGDIIFWQNTMSQAGVLSPRAIQAVLAPQKAALARFGKDNRVMLKLNQTEFNPRDLTSVPFSPRWLTQDDARLFNTYSTVYKPVEDGSERLLFTRSGQVEKTPLHLESALDEYKLYLDDSRALGTYLKPGEVATAQAAKSPGPTNLWQYDTALTVRAADQIQGNLARIDQAVAAEVDELAAKGAWYQRAIDDASDATITQATTGIWKSVDVLPKGGAYGKAAEISAEARTAVSDAFMRRVGRTGTNLVQTGWASRPVLVISKIGDALGRGMTPATIKMGDPEAWVKVDQWLRRVKNLHPGTRNAWVHQMMGLTTEQEKLDLLEKIEANVIRHMLKAHKVDHPGTVEQIVSATLGSKKAFIGKLADDALARGKGGLRGKTTGYNAIKPVMVGPDGTAIVAGPQVVKQLANEQPLLPIDELEKAFKRDRSVLQGFGFYAGADPVASLTTGLSRIWKTSVLLRVGYPVRTVSDEVLLAGAALSSLMYYGGGLAGAGRVARNVPAHLANKTPLVGRVAKNKRMIRRRELPDVELAKPKYQRGMDDVEIMPGVFVRGVFNDGTGITKSLVSADQRDLYGLHDDLLVALRKATNKGELDPENEATHLAAWVHALNHQLGSDVVARKFLRGDSREAVHAWLDTHEGAAYMRRLPLQNANREDWLDGLAHMVYKYTGDGNPALMHAALTSRVKVADLKRVPMAARPPVHGGEIDFAMGTGAFSDLMTKAANGFYTMASKLPTDVLVRHPMADMLYQRRLRQLIADAEAQGVKVAERPDRLYHYESIARQWTVKRMDTVFKDHLFSSPQTALRFVMPFFGAWRGSLARWARMIGEDPSIVSRAAQGWQGLHKPFDVVDENGEPVEWTRLDKDGNQVRRYTLNDAGERVENPEWAKAKPRDSAKEIYGFDTKNQIVVRLPKWAWSVVDATPFLPHGTQQDAAGRTIPLRSFNTVIQGDPWFSAGFGPFVTVPIASLVRGKPHMANVAQKTGVLPFGARESWKDHVLPSWGQRAVAQNDDDSRARAMTMINILRVQVARIQRGERSMPSKAEFNREINQRTDNLMTLRRWESFFLPFSTRPVYYSKDWEGKTRRRYDAQGTPLPEPGGWEKLPKEWQFLAAKLRDYKTSLGNEQGEEVFLEEFPEAWLWMESTSKNNSGIPANFKSWDSSRAVKRLAESAPDVFDSAAGVLDTDYDEFSSAVYDAQMNSKWNEVTGQKYRETRDPWTFLQDAEARRGWVKYSKFMDHVRNQLEQRGILALTHPGAEDLQQEKRNYVQFLRQTNPAWANEYDTPDPTRSQRIREQAWTVANDPKLASDPQRTPELKTLKFYLAGRADFARRLQAMKQMGGSSDIQALTNIPLLSQWEAFRQEVAHRSSRFSELWLDRYFGNDYFQEMT